MRATMRNLLWLVSLSVAPGWGQLHVITGTPTPSGSGPGYSTSLFRVEPAGGVTMVANLVPASVGTEWIAVANDHRKVLVLPDGEGSALVVDFDAAAVVKSCKVPSVWHLIEQWLWDVPGRGLVFAEFLSEEPGERISGMVLDPSVPCSRSFSDLSPGDAKYLVASGYAGVAGMGSHDGMRVQLDRTGKISRFFPTGRAYFDAEVPPAMFRDVRQPIAAVMANNRALIAVGVTEDSDPSSQRLVVFRKSDRTWHRVPSLSERFSWTRAFGGFVAVVAGETKGARLRASPGRADWRQENTAGGPNQAAVFEGAELAFPGRLHLYNVETERVDTITTNQGDSEILLVENETVYYRVSDRLYSVPITKTGLGEPRQLAKSDVIRDAHWAFLRH